MPQCASCLCSINTQAACRPATLQTELLVPSGGAACWGQQQAVYSAAMRVLIVLDKYTGYLQASHAAN